MVFLSKSAPGLKNMETWKHNTHLTEVNTTDARHRATEQKAI